MKIRFSFQLVNDDGSEVDHEIGGEIPESLLKNLTATLKMLEPTLRYLAAMNERIQ